MSARGTSRGGLRRSSSLTTLNTLSRPSIGIGQHGPQRVSGVGCDSRVRNSGGNSRPIIILSFYSCCILCQIKYNCWFCSIGL